MCSDNIRRRHVQWVANQDSEYYKQGDVIMAINGMKNLFINGLRDDGKFINTSTVLLYKLPSNALPGWVLTQSRSVYLWEPPEPLLNLAGLR